MRKQFLIIVAVVFVILGAGFFALIKYAPQFDLAALETGNAIMAALSVITYTIVRRQVDNRPQAFVRSVYSASFLKLMVCMISILVYVLLNRLHIHKPSVFMLFGIYAVYTIMETWVLSRIVR